MSAAPLLIFAFVSLSLGAAGAKIFGMRLRGMAHAETCTVQGITTRGKQLLVAAFYTVFSCFATQADVGCILKGRTRSWLC